MMTRFHIALGLVLAMVALPTATLADNPPSEQLILSVERELPAYVRGVNVRDLSSSQIIALYMAMGRSQGHAEVRAEVRSILGGLDVFLFGRNLAVQ